MTFIHFSSFNSPDIFDLGEDDTIKVRTCTVRTYLPHIVPYKNFNAGNDCEKLKEALEGPGINEQCIIDILTARTNDQRKEIAFCYANSFDRELIDDLNKKLSGKFRDIIIGLMTPLDEYLCKELHKSLTGLSTDEDALVEILCTKTNKEMTQLIEAYENLYNRPLVEHLCSSTGGHFRRLLTMIVTGTRDQSNIVDPVLVVKQVAALQDTGKGKLVATDQEVFNRILSHDNFAQLRKVFAEYENVSGRTIEDAVVDEIRGDLREAMLAIIESVQSAPAFFAKRLFLALDGLMTNDATIIRIIVSRSEIDLGIIKTEFEKLYDQTLLSVVKNKTSGEYKHVLCRIIG